MNPANFSNAGGGMPGGAKPPGQMQVPQQQKPEIQVMMNFLAQTLQSQGPFSGWRAEVSLKERAINVYQMWTSLRLIQPQANIQSLAQAALTFEQKAFRDAKEKVDYDKDCNDKLIHIRDTRARQAAVIQQNGGMMAQPGHAANMAAGQAQFAQQMGRPVQASPIPAQQLAMGLNDPNQQAAMQHRQQQQQQQQQQSQQPQPQNMLQQQRAQRPGNGLQLTDDLSTLSQQDHENVQRIANQIMAKTSPDDIEKIKMNLQNMTPEQRQYLSRKNMDPLTYFFRSQALTHFRRHKRARIEAQRSQNAGVDPHNAMVGDPMMNPQQRQLYQNMLNLQRNSFSVGSQPNLDPSSFIGNVENIQGQQADGLRSQEAGQLVVPASSSQMNQQPFTAQNMFQVSQGGQPNMNGAGISPQFFSQQHLQNSQNMQQDRAQQAPQFQAQSQAQTQAQARAQAAQKAQMAISQAGQANSQMQQQMTQQSPAMPMLNRPMAAPGQMSPAQVATQVRPPSRAPGQQPNPVQSLGGQPTMQGRPQIPPNLPPTVQDQLARMSQEQLAAFFMQRRPMGNNQAMARANATQQAMPMQQNLSQPGQGQQMANGQMGNNQNMRVSLNLQQQLAGMGGAQLPNQMLPGQQQLSAQQRQQQQQQQRQHDLYKMQLLRQQTGGLELSPEQMKDMDRLPYPPSILSNNPNVSSPVPKHIKTWGQLKQWVSANPQVLGGIDPQKLVTFQKYHLSQILLQNKEGNRNSDNSGQGPWMQMPFQGQPQQFMNSQQLQNGQQAPVNMPPMRPITTQDIQMARQRFGAQVQTLSDEQLRDMILKNRQKQWMQLAAQSRAAQFAAQQGQQTQASQQPPVTAPSATPQIKSEVQSQQQSAQINQQNQAIKAQNATPGKGAKGPAVKQPPKRKMPSEEGVETPTTSIQKPTQPAPAQGVSGPMPHRPSLPFTRDQLAAMPPQQRAQIEAHMRRQQGQTQARPIITRAAAEEAWNNLPEKIRQLYNEISKQAPPVEPAPITPEQKAQMSHQLRESTDMLSRLDTLVQWFFKIPNQDKSVRTLCAMRIQMMRQFKPGPDWTLNDHYTITPDSLLMSINYIKKLFQAMISRVSQHQNGQRPSVSQGPANVQQSTQNNMPALNATNLQQLQQQEEAIHRARRASSQTAVSTTSAVPPAPFGAPSPQGVPHAYGPGSMPPQELKLPPPKKRKQSHAGPIPNAGAGSTKPQTAKQATTDAKAAVAALAGPFKCDVPECQHHYQGFATQAALDKHIEENHKAEESIEDPLQFALDSFSSFAKEENKPLESQEPKKSGSTLETPQMPPKIGIHSPSTKETGATPATAGATPIGRVPSQLGPKPISPASSQMPRAPPGKVSAAAKSSGIKEGRKEVGEATDRLPPGDVTTEDPWAASTISLEAIQDTFMDFGDDSSWGLGPMDEFLNADMFANTQSKDTPDSVETAIVTQTPKDNDLPRSGDMVSKGGDPVEDNWIPVDWVNLPGRSDDGLLMNEPWEEIDWETIDRRDNMSVDDGGIAICAM